MYHAVTNIHALGQDCYGGNLRDMCTESNIGYCTMNPVDTVVTLSEGTIRFKTSSISPKSYGRLGLGYMKYADIVDAIIGMRDQLKNVNRNFK